MDLLKGEFSKKKILVVGDVMLDRYWFGDSSRISPEAPVPIVKIEKIEERLGGAGNVALNIANLGVKTTLLAATGRDESGKKVEELLNQAHIEPLLEMDSMTKTIVKQRIIARNQQVLRCDFEDSPCEESLLRYLNVFTSILHRVNAVVFSDYGKGGLNHIESMIREALNKEIPVFIDPKGSDYSKYHNATVITPNKKELAEVIGKWNTEDQLNERAQNLRKELKIKHLLLTRSEEGMTLFNENGNLTIPTEAREVYDVSGAGDTVISVLSASYCLTNNIEESIFLANKAAGIVVGKIGTAAITLDELRTLAY